MYRIQTPGSRNVSYWGCGAAVFVLARHASTPPSPTSTGRRSPLLAHQPRRARASRASSSVPHWLIAKIQGKKGDKKDKRMTHLSIPICFPSTSSPQLPPFRLPRPPPLLRPSRCLAPGLVSACGSPRLRLPLPPAVASFMRRRGRRRAARPPAAAAAGEATGDAPGPGAEDKVIVWC